MKWSVRLLVFVLFLGHSALEAQSIKVGIWRDGRETNRFYYHSDEEVTWLLNGKQLVTIEAGRTCYFTKEGRKVKLSTSKKSYGFFNTIRLEEGADTFTLKSIKPTRREEIYNQGIQIKVKNEGLEIINFISDFDSYIAGVVESESGKEQILEYYKVQSVISRTYALSNIRRHEHEGFNLCDQVHCQVYHGISRFNPEIPKAAKASEGQVLVDSDLNLITATFHSNCGGHTVNSEDVWTKALPYLKGRPDTFCLNSPHAKWEATILKSAWNDYLLEKQFKIQAHEDHVLYSYAPEERQINYPMDEKGFALKELRSKWRLNSTYFEIEELEDKLILRGKGFGHGVGLCQEGAMNMSNQGLSYQEVLQFYYRDVHLVHLSVLDFFKEN